MFKDLKARAMVARRAQDKQTLTILSTLIGNLQANSKMVDGEKVVTDEGVISMVRYNLKGLNEMLKHSPDDADVQFEIELLQSLLPQQMTEEEIKVAVSQIVMGGADNMGSIMAGLKARHAGLYDGKTASQIAKAALA